MTELHCLPMSLDRHDPKVVAQLIYLSAPELFRLLFGGTAIEVIQALITRSDNRLSHRYVYIAECDQQIVGSATVVPALELNNDTDYQIILNVWTQLWRKLVYWLILNRVLQQTYPADSFYIANLAVFPAYQGRGIGTQLLQHCIARATAAGANQLFISVDIHNPKAQKLYESLGFQVIETKTLSLLTITVGSRVLVRSLSH